MNIEKSQQAFMSECARNGCNHQCNEGRDCENSGIDWLTAGIYVASACFSISIIAGSVVFLRWLIA